MSSRIEPQDKDKRSGRKASFSDILDRTQGHLILRWNASHSAEILQRIGLISLYCAAVIVLLVVFSVESFVRGQQQHAAMLLLFAGLTVSAWFYHSITGNRHNTKILLVLLFGAFCLFQMYTGGIAGTGPLWYFAFPAFALFLLRLWAGVLAVTGLFLLTLLLFVFPLGSFDADQYSNAFMVRFLGVYLVVTVMAFLYAFLRTTSELVLDNLSDHLRELADTDDLTRLPNRRRTQDILYQEVGRMRRGGRPFCIILLDIDQFKHVNDTHGHDSGDQVLKIFADVINGILREPDTCGRWGGEEFMIVLPETKLEDARKAAERIRRAVRNHNMKSNGKDIYITVSLGVREYQIREELDECIKDTDRKLLQAKKEGGNQVVI